MKKEITACAVKVLVIRKWSNGRNNSWVIPAALLEADKRANQEAEGTDGRETEPPGWETHSSQHQDRRTLT